MELTKAKYKQTEVGLIPWDWKTSSIDVLTENGGLIRGPFGGALKKEFFVREGYKVYEQKNAIYQSVELGSYYVDDLKFRELKRFEIKEGDFILSCSGTIGRIYKIPKVFKKGIINQALLIIRLNPDNIESDYFYHQFVNDTFQKKVIDDTQGGAMKNLVGMSEFRKASIPLPPTLNEQKAIATALSDVNDLISNLDKLISKKKDIKQGAMQQLLTPPHEGGKRLEGYTGEWEEKKLGGYADLITKGTTPTSLGKAFTTEGINFIKAESIDKTGKIINDKVAFIDTETHEILSRSKMKANDLLFTIAGVLGRVGVVLEENLPANTNQAVAIIRLKRSSDLSIEFFFHILRTKAIEKHIEAISVQGAQANFSLTDVANIPLNIPKDIEEQQAIAQILSDMDKEIGQLEIKKAKYHDIKQGMMQELLTGKTRLV